MFGKNMMFNKNNEHSDVYQHMKLEDTSAFKDKKIEEEDYKFKKSMSLDPRFETVMNYDKSKINKAKERNPEPMEPVAQKIRKGLPLNVWDLETWVEYNYLVLNEDDKSIIDRFVMR